MSVRKLFPALLLALLALLATPALAAEAGQPAEPAAYDGYLVRLESGAERRLASPETDGLQAVAYVDGLYLAEDAAQLTELSDRGLLAYAEPNYILELLDGAAPDDPKYAEQWTLEAIGYAALYQSGYDGENVTVAVIDSGLYIAHEDFAGTAISPYSKNFLGDGTEKAEQAFTRDQKGHGTFVASQIAPSTGNAAGLAGVAGGAELMVLRCIADGSSSAFPYETAYDANSGSIAVVVSAIHYAADNGADVINISLGSASLGAAGNTALQEAVNYADEKGVILVAAAGNGGGTALYYPAANEHVIGVGSVSRSDGALVRSSFSQYNTSVKAAAPGGDVLGVQIYPAAKGVLYTDAADTYRVSGGTSYAAPVVSALAAIAKQINPALDGADFLSLLAAASTDCGAAGYDTSFGYGAANAAALLDALTAREYELAYELNGSEDAPARMPEGYARGYTLGRTEAVTLPVPTRDGYLFQGWYAERECSGLPVTELPAGALGLATYREEDGAITYPIGPVTYYAKWEEITGPSSVTVKGFAAVAAGENVYALTLPAGTVEALTALTAADVAVVSTPEAVVSELADDGKTFRFTVGGVAYTVEITLSGLRIPVVAEAMASQSGTARLPSLDGLTAATAYSAQVSGWFTDAETYQIVANSGGGAADLTDGVLTYLPGGGDYAGQTVTLAVRAANADFQSTGVVTVALTLARGPSSAVVTPAALRYDLDTGGTLTAEISLYDNTLAGLLCGEVELPESGYTVAAAEGDVASAVRVTLAEDFLRSLAVGTHTITFRFSAGADAERTLTVSDSAPRFDVRFYLEKADSTPYHTLPAVRRGSTVGTLPAEPSKTGQRFTGWYLADGTTRVTAATVVGSELSVYASWQADGGTGGTGGGMGGGGGGLPIAPQEETGPEGATFYSAERLPADLTAGQPVELTVERGDTGIALSGAAVQKLIKADAPLWLRCDAGELTVPAAALAALRSGDAQLVLSLTALSDSESRLRAAGVPVDRAVGAYAVVAALVEDGALRPAASLPGAALSLHLGKTSAGRRVLIRPEKMTDAEGTPVTADDAGSATLALDAPGVLLVYLREPLPFGDVAADAWYYDAVEYAFRRGLMSGVGEKRFAPGSTATRAMLAAVLYRREGSPQIAGTGRFTDLAPGSWYVGAAVWADEQGLMNGYDDAHFGPNDPITRQQLAALFWRYAGSPEPAGGLAAFHDAAQAATYAVKALSWAVEKGILTGRTDGTLDPAAAASRAEIAAILQRFETATGQ